MMRTALGALLVLFLNTVLSPCGVADEEVEVTRFRSFILDSLGIEGAVTQARLSPDKMYASIEVQFRNTFLLYLLDIEKGQMVAIDPRHDLEGYQEWRQSQLSNLYPVADRDAQWYPGDERSGQWLVFRSNGIDNQYDLFLFHPATRTYVRMTQSQEDESQPRWSQDGRALGFTQSVSGTELYVIEDMDRLFAEIQKVQLSYNQIPSLDGVYNSSIFDKTIKLFFATRDQIKDYVWLYNNSLALLQGNASEPASRRLYLLQGNGKARFVALAPNASRVVSAPFVQGVTVITRRENADFDEYAAVYYDAAALNGPSGTAGPEPVSLGPDGLTAPPFALSPTRHIVVRTRRNGDQIAFRRIMQVQQQDKPLALPKKGLVTSLDVHFINNETPYQVAMLGIIKDDGGTEIFLVEASYQPDDEEEPIMQKRQFVEVGFVADFSKYTGDVVTGDFLPGGGVWADIRFTEGFADISAGLKVLYSPLGGSSKSSGSFTAFFWETSAYLKYTYPLFYELKPFFSLGVGVAASNVRSQENRPDKRQTPYFFEVTGGGVFSLTTRINIVLMFSFVKFSEDIDMLTRRNNSDSHILIGLGASYTIPL